MLDQCEPSKSPLLLLSLSDCGSILLLNLQVPPYAKLGEDVRLVCLYDLEYDGLYRCVCVIVYYVGSVYRTYL